MQYREGRFEEVKQILNDALEKNAEERWAWIALGEAHISMGEPKEAAEQFRNATQIFPTEGWVWKRLLEAYLTDNNLTDAISYGNLAMKHVPRDSVLPKLLGDAYFRNGDVGKSMDAYKLAIDRADDPSFMSGFLYTGTERNGTVDVWKGNPMEGFLWPTLVKAYRALKDEESVSKIQARVRGDYEEATTVGDNSLLWQYCVDEETIFVDPSQGNGYWIRQELDHGLIMFC